MGREKITLSELEEEKAQEREKEKEKEEKEEEKYLVSKTGRESIEQAKEIIADRIRVEIETRVKKINWGQRAQMSEDDFDHPGVVVGEILRDYQIWRLDKDDRDVFVSELKKALNLSRHNVIHGSKRGEKLTMDPYVSDIILKNIEEMIDGFNKE